MPQAQASEELDNGPSPFRLQHPLEKADCIYDEAYRLGIITSHQHSDMAHWCMMREAFLQRNGPRATVIGKLMDGCAGNDVGIAGASLADKYSLFLRDAPPVTQQALLALASPYNKNHKRKMFYQAREIIECHLTILRKWLDAA